MAKDVQISAVVSKETKALLERLVESTGLKKGFVVEMALRHHLQALQELPADAIIPPKIVLTRKSGEELIRRLRSPKAPTRELRKLMSGDGDKTSPTGR